MYIRQLKQYLRGVDQNFDERKYGFETLGDLMRACQRDGLLRVERDRQGGMRVFPGNLATATATPPTADDVEPQEAAVSGEPVTPADGAESFDRDWTPPVDRASEPEIVEGAVLQEIEVPPVVDAEEAPAPSGKAPRRRPRAAKGARATAASGEARNGRKSGDASAPKARRPAAKPRAARGRGRTDASHE
jgi:hypothetical protein